VRTVIRGGKGGRRNSDEKARKIERCESALETFTPRRVLHGVDDTVLLFVDV
jgi:hypothetical protein